MAGAENHAEELIAVKYDHGGPTFYIKENPRTFGERVADFRAVDLCISRLQLAKHAGLCERTVIRIEQGEVTKLLLPSALAIAQALGVSLDWLCGRIDISGDDVDDNSREETNGNPVHSTRIS